MLGNNKPVTKQSTYVGLPGKGRTFTVHPTDQTDENRAAHLYYNKDNKRSYIIDASTYPDVEELYENLLEGLTSSVLYRAMYSDGNEFIIPIHDYANNTVLNDIINLGKQATWFERINNEYRVDHSAHLATWSKLTFEQLLDQAFDGFVIDNEDHPLVDNFVFLRR